MGEKAAALVASEAMMLKSKMGMGIDRKCNTVCKREKYKTNTVCESGSEIKRKNRSKLSTVISAAKKN